MLTHDTSWEVKAMSQASLLSSCGMSQQRRAGSRQREIHCFLYDSKCGAKMFYSSLTFNIFPVQWPSKKLNTIKICLKLVLLKCTE